MTKTNLTQIANFKKDFESFGLELRIYLADNLPDSAGDALAALASDGSDMVRAAVAANPHTPAEVRELLARDGSEWVREAVANSQR